MMKAVVVKNQISEAMEKREDNCKGEKEEEIMKR